MSPYLPRRLPSCGLVIAVALLLLAAVPAVSRAAACDALVTNPVACENTKTGDDPSTWEIDGAGDPSIQGFATSMSVNKGNSISFKIKAPNTNYKIDILRLGWYGGRGARRIASGLTPTGSATQPACLTQSTTGLIDCGNWSVSRTWTVPSDAVSGVYIALLHRNDTGGESHITFVVRDDASTSPVVLQTSDATWQAYNTYGGNSLYTCAVACPPGNPSTYKAAYKVSYNRPLNTAEDDGGRSALFTGAEYPMIRFLERAGYNMSYVSSVDVHRRGNLLAQHKLFISSGHDEYWSKTQRDNVEAARDAGVNLAFFSGNEVFWKTRWESSIDGSSTQDRTLASYKDTHFEQQEDPVEWTGTWRDPRFTTPPNRPTPENALTGTSFLVNFGSSDITVPFAYKNLRMWRNTAVTSLASGQSLRLAASTLGYEWDVDADNGFRPAGQFRLSSTTVGGLEVFTDYGSTVAANGTATHNLVAYRAPSGALVFGAGTVQWSWGLDDQNPLGTAPNVTMQQATVNLFADMDAQPFNTLPGVVPATKSTDITKPASTITNPPASVNDGTSVTISGTASDNGGGVVAGVEVSTDGGATWHPATTATTSWTYTWVAHGSPTASIKSRATDDSGNIQVPGAGVNVAVNCPCSLWGNGIAPPAADGADPNGAELGVKFTSDAYGTISGIRFYKAATNTGTHTGSLWTTTGTRLAQVTFANESASGWQTATFSSPVQVQPNTTYIASYHAPNGHFAATSAYFYANPAPGPNGGAIADSPPLHAVRNSGTTTNGMYAYSSTSTFPANSFGASNYWVDVMFTPTPAPGQVTNVTATSGGTTSANVAWNAPSSGGDPTSYVVTPRINGVAQTPKTVTGTPPLTTTTVTGLTNATTYTFTVKASNPSGSGPESASSNSVTPLNPVVPAAPTSVDARPATQRALVSWTAPGSDGDSPITGYTITPYIASAAQTPTTVGASATSATVSGLTNGSSYTFKVRATNAVGDGPDSAASSAVVPQSTIFDLATPTTVDSQDGNAVELGVKFTASAGGSVTGVRFYKSSANTGAHAGSLWTSTGTRLAQATFTNETAAGWQTATFASPVAITAGTTYIASYFAPSGHYSASGGGLSSAVTNGPLQAVGNGTSANGVYVYGAASAFPSNSYNATNYFIDVMFALPVPGQVTNVTAVEAGQTSATVSWTAPSSGGSPASYIVTPRINGVAQPSKTVTAPTTSTTVGSLTTRTTYTFTVTATNANGNGPASAPSNAVTPQTAVVPTAPTNVDARPATSSARVSWDVPSGNGDSPITGYTITPYIGSVAQTPTTAAASATSATVSGLTNGTSYTFRVTASNAVGNSPASAPSNAVTPAYTIFDFATPSVADAADGISIELGVKFTASSSGSITGVRFYKSTLNTGTHTGSLWSAAGTRLAQATFTNETATGWQTVTFASPVAIAAGTTYVASYFAPIGHYSVSSGGLSSSVTNGPLTALGNSTSSNGVYAYGAASGFPNSSFNATNYWVDAMFAHAPSPAAPTSVTATAGQASAAVSWTAPSTGGAPTSYTVTPRINGVAQTPKTISGSPPATSTTVTGLTPGTAYTFTVTASNAGGTSPASAPSNSVTPTGATAPDAPTGVAATADTTSAIVGWTAPANDGGSAITGYTITPFIGTTAQATTMAGASATSTRVSGLTNGTSYTFRVTATNAIGNSAASAASNAVKPLSSIFEFGTPATADAGDASAVNLGVKFTSDVAGTVTGLRFYKEAANTGTHVGSLWTAGGTLLAQATFTGESASGWQTVSFSTPVTITAGTMYVASYLAPNGHYSVSAAAFASAGTDNPPLHALANSIGANGVYAYGGSSAFPTNSFNATNYWVDVLFGAA
jgi:N,N-dimethylformamidase beta subunit-like protein/uncharacterized protein DUF4082/fibronectin type III domain protein/Big-like domain-containing protein